MIHADSDTFASVFFRVVRPERPEYDAAGPDDHYPRAGRNLRASMVTRSRRVCTVAHIAPAWASAVVTETASHMRCLIRAAQVHGRSLRNGQERTMGDALQSSRSRSFIPLATFAGSYHPRLPEAPVKSPKRTSGPRARPRLLLTRSLVPVKLKMYLDKTRGRQGGRMEQERKPPEELFPRSSRVQEDHRRLGQNHEVLSEL